MDYKYTSMSRIFAKHTREISSDFDEGDVIEMTGEALEFINAINSYEEMVAFIEVKNHQFDLPSWLHNVIQIARDNQWTDVRCECPITVPDVAMEMATCGCKGKITWQDNKAAGRHSLCWDDDRGEYIMIDAYGQPIEDYELAYYRPYFDLRMEYDMWLGCHMYRNRFTPVRLSTSKLYDTLVCREPHRVCGPDTYTIIKNQTVRTSFESGMVAIAYNRQVLEDLTGYPMIPDDISFTSAIIAYIRWINLGKTDYGSPKWREADRQWQWYCKQASNKDFMPHGVDEHQNLLDQRQYLIPRTNAYNSFFGNLAVPEYRRFNDPNLRNNSNLFTH